jgi:hypothetical protein
MIIEKTTTVQSIRALLIKKFPISKKQYNEETDFKEYTPNGFSILKNRTKSFKTLKEIKITYQLKKDSDYESNKLNGIKLLAEIKEFLIEKEYVIRDEDDLSIIVEKQVIIYKKSKYCKKCSNVFMSVYKEGMCKTCYNKSKQMIITCSICNKEKLHAAKQMCSSCYQKYYNNKIITCIICNEEKPHAAKQMCKTCYDTDYRQKRINKRLSSVFA